MFERSFLFVPASRADRVDKALSGDADAVIVDLEDGVAVGEKGLGREALETWRSGSPYIVRINAIGTDHFADDIVALRRMRNVVGVVIPKVESPSQVVDLRCSLERELDIYALVESANGMLNAADIARAGVVRLMLGSADYCAQLGVAPSSDALAFARSTLVVASAAAGLAPPVDGPALSFDDLEQVESEARQARALGCGAKLCIHPRQIEAVNAVFSPSSAELAWAHRVVEHADTAGGGATALDGTMIDEPVLRRARALLEPR